MKLFGPICVPTFSAVAEWESFLLLSVTLTCSFSSYSVDVLLRWRHPHQIHQSVSQVAEPVQLFRALRGVVCGFLGHRVQTALGDSKQSHVRCGHKLHEDENSFSDK